MGNACLKLFDRNGDGQVTPDEVIQSLGKVVDIIALLTKQASMITKALQDAGIDTKKALDVLNTINSVVSLADELGDKFEKIKIPKSLEEIGDVNKDGHIDKDDLVSYLTSSKEICETLIKNGIKVDLVTQYRDEIQKVIDSVKSVPRLVPQPLR